MSPPGDSPDAEHAYAALVRVLSQLEDELPYATAEDVHARLSAADHSLTLDRTRDLLDGALREGVVFVDARTRFERTTVRFIPAAIYRVNHRHPLARDLL